MFYRHLKHNVLAFCVCWNEFPQTWWFQATATEAFTVLQARNLKSVSLIQNQDVGRTALPPETVGDSSFPWLLQLLVAAGIPWLVATSVRCHLLWSHRLLYLSSLPLPSLNKLHALALRAHPRIPGKCPHHTMLNSITSTKTVFTYKATITGSRD